jgi:hypothetical protein
MRAVPDWPNQRLDIEDFGCSQISLRRNIENIYLQAVENYSLNQWRLVSRIFAISQFNDFLDAGFRRHN